MQKQYVYFLATVLTIINFSCTKEESLKDIENLNKVEEIKLFESNEEFKNTLNLFNTFLSTLLSRPPISNPYLTSCFQNLI